MFIIADHPTSILIKPVPDGIMEPNSTIACGPADGYPVASAAWEVVMGPERASLYYNIMGNGAQIHLKENCTTKSEWEIKCVVKSCLEDVCKILNRMISFRIANHPTALYIQPIIKKRFRSNSTIKCYTKDGYPDPEINWQFIEGPPNADRFYNFPGKGDQIHINSNSPTGSNWTFRCTMKSILVNTKKMLNKTISFAIAKNPIKLCDEKCLNSRISEIEESLEENERLHADIRLVLNITDQIKEQIASLGKALRNKQIEESNKQKEESDKLKSSLERVFKQMRLEFHFSFNRVTDEKITSPKFISKHLLTAQFWLTKTSNYRHYFGQNFECGMILESEIPIASYLEVKYKCDITFLVHNYHNSVYFNMTFNGNRFDSQPVQFYYNQNYYTYENILVQCYLQN